MRTTFWRTFDPLKPVDRLINCAFHIPVHVEDSVRDSDSRGMIEDFVVSRRCIEKFREYSISNIPDFKLDLVVSINGDITHPKFIEYFRSIDNQWLSDKVFCKVYQRTNTGYQWGGFHDVWMRYKDTCEWFATMEADHRFMFDNWFDMVLEHVGDGSKFTFSKYQYPKIWGTPQAPVGRPAPASLWRNTDGSTKINPPEEVLLHSCGAFHFCHNDILTKLDNAFGCFTFSMGCANMIDGIIQGEIAFCQKIREFGHIIKSGEIEYLVRPMRGSEREGNPEGDHLIVEKEVAEWV